MAIRITPPRDDRIERALANPKDYFRAARRRARAEVAEEIEQEERAAADRRNDPDPRRAPDH